MPASNWRNMLKQLRKKPAVMKRFLKYCKPKTESYSKDFPKERKFGIASKRCTRCGRFGAHINSYGLHLCRQCFREIAKELGFKKYQ